MAASPDGGGFWLLGLRAERLLRLVWCLLPITWEAFSLRDCLESAPRATIFEPLPLALCPRLPVSFATGLSWTCPEVAAAVVVVVVVVAPTSRDGATPTVQWEAMLTLLSSPLDERMSLRLRDLCLVWKWTGLGDGVIVMMVGVELVGVELVGVELVVRVRCRMDGCCSADVRPGDGSGAGAATLPPSSPVWSPSVCFWSRLERLGTLVDPPLLSEAVRLSGSGSRRRAPLPLWCVTTWCRSCKGRASSFSVAGLDRLTLPTCWETLPRTAVAATVLPDATEGVACGDSGCGDGGCGDGGCGDGGCGDGGCGVGGCSDGGCGDGGYGDSGCGDGGRCDVCGDDVQLLDGDDAVIGVGGRPGHSPLRRTGVDVGILHWYEHSSSSIPTTVSVVTVARSRSAGLRLGENPNPPPSLHFFASSRHTSMSS